MMVLASLVRNAWRSLFAAKSGEALDVVSWNVAAINNNPWEYYMESSAEYDALMREVQEMMSGGKASLDEPVGSIFSDAMAAELFEQMRSCGFEAVEAVEAYWRDELRARRALSEFVTDSSFGSKRLCSMPDRVTNTPAEGVYRPTVTNFYPGPLGSVEEWWRPWLAYMFEQGHWRKLKKIPRAKYPALTEAEETMSLPLQTLCLAVFDAVLVSSLNAVAPAAWPALRARVTVEMSPAAKTRKTIQLLEREFDADVAVVFLQEVGPALASYLRTRLPAKYALAAAVLDGPQVSAIVVDATRFPGPYETLEVALDSLAPGDLVVANTANGYALASFHGDTDGRATVPAIRAVAAAAKDRTLLFGLDANAYAPDKMRATTLAATDFLDALTPLGLTSCFDPGRAPPATTYNARTFLQPQIQKAVPFDQRKTSKLTDNNPKDYIVFDASAFAAADTSLDNTGDRRYLDAPFPTLAFPSDHAILKTTLKPRDPSDDAKPPPLPTAGPDL